VFWFHCQQHKHFNLLEARYRLVHWYQQEYYSLFGSNIVFTTGGKLVFAIIQEIEDRIPQISKAYKLAIYNNACKHTLADMVLV